MKNEDYQAIIDAIDVPIEKLQASSVLYKKSKRKAHKLVITSIVIVAFIVAVVSVKNITNSVSNDYFLTTIYAKDKSTILDTGIPIEITMNNNIFKNNVGIGSTENQVQIKYPLDIQIEGKNIKQIKYTLNNNTNGLLYQGTSYHLLEDKEYSKLEIDGHANFDRKEFIELTEKEKEIFCQYLNISNHALDEEQYIRNFKNAVYKKESDSIYEYKEDELWKQFFWLYEQIGKEMVVDYNKQDPSLYKIVLEEIINYDSGNNPMNNDAIKLYQDVKKELTTYTILVAIEYTNGIVKEKNITFKEVITDNIDILTGQQEVTVVMEIK